MSEGITPRVAAKQQGARSADLGWSERASISRVDGIEAPGFEPCFGEPLCVVADIRRQPKHKASAADQEPADEQQGHERDPPKHGVVLPIRPGASADRSCVRL